MACLNCFLRHAALELSRARFVHDQLYYINYLIPFSPPLVAILWPVAIFRFAYVNTKQILVGAAQGTRCTRHCRTLLPYETSIYLSAFLGRELMSVLVVPSPEEACGNTFRQASNTTQVSHVDLSWWRVSSRKLFLLLDIITACSLSHSVDKQRPQHNKHVSQKINGYNFGIHNRLSTESREVLYLYGNGVAEQLSQSLGGQPAGEPGAGFPFNPEVNFHVTL